MNRLRRLLQAGEEIRVNGGRYLLVLEKIGDIEIHLLNRDNTALQSLSDVPEGFCSIAMPFGAARVVARTLTYVDILASDTEVSTPYGSLRRNARAFFVGTGETGIPALNFFRSQLWNPATSETIFLLDAIEPLYWGADNYAEGVNSAAELAALTALNNRTSLVENALSDTLASEAVFYTGYHTAKPASYSWRTFVGAGGNALKVIGNNTPIIIPPGKGYEITGSTVATDLAVFFRWREASII